MKNLIGFAICTCAWAQQLGQPHLGKMLDQNGAVRTVYGIAASVSVGAAETTGVLSSACATFCLAKTETSIVSASGSVEAPPGPALFAFDGNTAFVWFPRSRQFAEWVNSSLQWVPQNSVPDGEVLSIGVNAGVVQFAVRRRSGIWIVNRDGGVASSLPGAVGPVMLIPGGVVYATESEIVIRSVHVSLASVTAFSQMSGSYLQVRAGGVDYSLRIDPGHETLFQLPGVSQ